MAEAFLSDEPSAHLQPYLDEVLALLHQHFRSAPDPAPVAEAWCMGFVLVLARTVHRAGFLPAEMETFLAHMTTYLADHTRMAVRRWDEDGLTQP
jgi:hypothetical protein